MSRDRLRLCRTGLSNNKVVFNKTREAILLIKPPKTSRIPDILSIEQPKKRRNDPSHIENNSMFQPKKTIFLIAIEEKY